MDEQIMAETTDIVIIGAGHNGLVAACYLARAGLKVHILEARNLIGGACVTEELIPGFKFSTCANAAWALDEKVVSDLGLLERGLVVDPLDPIRFHPFPNGTYFFTWPDEDRTLAEIAKISDHDAAAWPRWRKFVERVGTLFGPLRYDPAPNLETLLASLTNEEDIQLVRKLIDSEQDEIIDEFFESSYLKAQLASYGPFTFSGGAGLGIAWGAMFTGGSLTQGYVRGGMGAITQALYSAALEAGVTIEIQRPVKRIMVDQGQITGVETVDGEFIHCDVVVSNADPKRTFLKLVDTEALDGQFHQAIEKIVTEPSCLKLHCAVSGLPTYAAYDGPDSTLPSRASVKLIPSREAFRQAYADSMAGNIPDHPAYSVMTPSLYDANLAPQGCHTISFYIAPIPYRLAEGNWNEMRATIAQQLIDMITTYAPNFRDNLIDYVLLTPVDLERQVLLTGGNIHHAEEIPEQLFRNRPLPALARYHTPITGLYLCGAGCHPGGEVSGLPGHNSAHVILEAM